MQIQKNKRNIKVNVNSTKQTENAYSVQECKKATLAVQTSCISCSNHKISKTNQKHLFMLTFTNKIMQKVTQACGSCKYKRKSMRCQTNVHPCTCKLPLRLFCCLPVVASLLTFCAPAPAPVLNAMYPCAYACFGFYWHCPALALASTRKWHPLTMVCSSGGLSP